jgi:hypothetical protein
MASEKLKLSKSKIGEQIRIGNDQPTVLTVAMKQLMFIERKYKLNDKLCTFLLESEPVLDIKSFKYARQ